MTIGRGQHLRRRRMRPVIELCEARTLLASPLTFTVTNANNAGAGSLREAIALANANLNDPGESDTIRIDITGTDRTVELITRLPGITDPLVLGLDANGMEPAAPLVEINGGTPGLAASGLTISTSDCFITGVAITRFTGSGLVITGNRNAVGGAVHIGTDIAGSATNLGNAGHGIAISGDNNVVSLATVVHNGGDGIAVLSGTGNDLLAVVHSNAGVAIDIGSDGITPNDPGDTDAGSNNSQNTPTLNSIGFAGGAVTVGGTINTTPNTTVLLNFFANPTATREGRTLLTQDVGGVPTTPSVTTGPTGDASFAVTLKGWPTDGVFGSVAPTNFITATATAENILNPGAPPDEQIVAFSTSEFSAPLGLPAWLAAGSAATWNALTKTLTLTGAATIVADPGADLPVVFADGATRVLTINPASGSAIHLGALHLSNDATAVVSSVGPLRSASNHRVLVIDGGIADLSIDASSSLDLQDNDLVLDYDDDGGDSPVLDVQAMLGTGYNFGGHDGPGIVSTAALNLDPFTFTLAYADNASLPLPYGSVFGGQPFAGVDVDDTAVLIKFTWVGDLTLDGIFDFQDLSLFNGNYDSGATAGRLWTDGDVTFDGVIDFQDLSLFNGNYDPNKPRL